MERTFVDSSTQASRMAGHAFAGRRAVALACAADSTGRTTWLAMRMLAVVRPSSKNCEMNWTWAARRRLLPRRRSSLRAVAVTCCELLYGAGTPASHENIGKSAQAASSRVKLPATSAGGFVAGRTVGIRPADAWLIGIGSGLHLACLCRGAGLAGVYALWRRANAAFWAGRFLWRTCVPSSSRRSRRWAKKGEAGGAGGGRGGRRATRRYALARYPSRSSRRFCAGRRLASLRWRATLLSARNILFLLL